MNSLLEEWRKRAWIDVYLKNLIESVLMVRKYANEQRTCLWINTEMINVDLASVAVQIFSKEQKILNRGRGHTSCPEIITNKKRKIRQIPSEEY